jgi:hypothetical protein
MPADGMPGSPTFRFTLSGRFPIARPLFILHVDTDSQTPGRERRQQPGRSPAVSGAVAVIRLVIQCLVGS